MLSYNKAQVETTKETVTGLINDYDSILELDKANIAPFEVSQEKSKFLDDLYHLESELEDLSENSSMALDSTKSAYNKLYNLELWDFFNDATSESDMVQLQEILENVMSEIEAVADFLGE